MTPRFPVGDLFRRAVVFDIVNRPGGVSHEAACAAHDISMRTFTNWRRDYGVADADPLQSWPPSSPPLWHGRPAHAPDAQPSPMKSETIGDAIDENAPKPAPLRPGQPQAEAWAMREQRGGKERPES